MTLSQYKDDFKSNFGWDGSISIGKIDNNQEKAICFYNSQRGNPYVGILGGKNNRTTNIKPVTILIRYTKNQNVAEKKAQEIYEFYEDRTFFIGSKRIFTIMSYNAPINLGTDDENVYEYSIELDFYEER